MPPTTGVIEIERGGDENITTNHGCGGSDCGGGSNSGGGDGGDDAPPVDFQPLRRKLEDEWLPQLLDILEITSDDLPVLWDADFMLGPKDADGDDTYVLCEINASSVSPYPDSATPLVARAAIRRALIARGKRR